MSRRRLLPSVLVALAAAMALPAGALAGGTLQPGAVHETDEGQCTLGFLFTDGAASYFGTAAHCVGQPGDDVRDADGDTFGDVALTGDPDENTEDFAFIRVRTGHVGRTSPAVKGSPRFPTGVTAPQDTNTGDLIQISGFGVGFGLLPLTQERRNAVMGFDDQTSYEVTGPLIYGDSGGPLVHRRTGRALGVVSRLCIGICTAEGPTVQGMLAKARARGLSLTLRTP